MRAGELKHRVTVERSTDAQDASGDPVKKWNPLVSNVPAAIEPLRGREFYGSNQTLAERDTRIRIHWATPLDDLSPKDRITHQGMIYNIVNVAQLKLARREIQIDCLSGVNDG